MADDILARRVAWPSARAIWRARIERVAEQFIAFSRHTGGTPIAIEEMGSVSLTAPPFTLFGKPDRIDEMPDGRLHLIDYKTGTPPTEAKQRDFEKQLLLAAALAENGGFKALGPREVAKITFFGVKFGTQPVETPLTPEEVAEVWAEFHRLIGAYQRRGQGYTSLRAMFETKFTTDYDHLARYGEWDLSTVACPEDVG